jgi:hypothetical protein
VVDNVALGQVFSEYFGFPFQFSFHRLLHIHHHLSSGAGTIGQTVADVPSGLSLTPPQETKIKAREVMCEDVDCLKLAEVNNPVTDISEISTKFSCSIKTETFWTKWIAINCVEKP